MRYELYHIVGKEEPFYIFDLQTDEFDLVLEYQRKCKKKRSWIIINNFPSLGHLDYAQLGYEKYPRLKEAIKLIYHCKTMKFIYLAQDCEDLSSLVIKAKEQAKDETLALLQMTVFLEMADYEAIRLYLDD